MGSYTLRSASAWHGPCCPVLQLATSWKEPECVCDLWFRRPLALPALNKLSVGTDRTAGAWSCFPPHHTSSRSAAPASSSRCSSYHVGSGVSRRSRAPPAWRCAGRSRFPRQAGRLRGHHHPRAALERGGRVLRGALLLAQLTPVDSSGFVLRNK